MYEHVRYQCVYFMRLKSVQLYDESGGTKKGIETTDLGGIQSTANGNPVFSTRLGSEHCFFEGKAVRPIHRNKCIMTDI